ncbi:WD repeat-containing protein 45 [Marchantia polymorpha subsp. ruderalis]|uniref:Autophagy-related protein 18a n=2 Tax=Marchantia polymorpha TaxID=3197 RepID=A0AAF6ALT5_MARPO|nr:hypothetical protein MARPO_0005s0065 [Marchantia polymorpha]BBM97403.1 hypothetical protein Mp_1g05420 [Marchantia polymorpha subsp. ruderalis]PTQ48401.1 hypothetical protein MARPO_0005s0065 [Marchantia polymorpha]PTQ48402.1 hypothetical protein MARPO_0005s0065 [Marchantia polymorpha]BBM97404.1 hypothetical protein Mp_1g05420 [Marchantia polymorpha subsp. ruderalis]|eukprot:PTQ48398.1 hypothetical protein MARPO_0005s0065 [Marchantia polymorpha]
MELLRNLDQKDLALQMAFDSMPSPRNHRHEKTFSNGSQLDFPQSLPKSPVSTSPHSSPRPQSPAEPVVLSIRFNQDNGCFACGTQTGFRVFNCHPFKENFRREFEASGIGLVEMLFRCNIIALVGGGKAPRYAPNKVMIWDDHQGRCIGELTFRSEVRAVRLRRDMILVVLEHKIYTYNFTDLKLLYSVETLANPKGLCAVSYSSSPSVMVCPGLRRGEVRVELYSQKKTKFIAAHEASLACFALSLDGSLLATASTKGTLIRIFNTKDCTKLQELRRGADRADIYSINFSPTNHWLVCSSDKGTVHVFSLQAPSGIDPKHGEAKNLNANSGSLLMAGSAFLNYAVGNAGSSLSFMKGVLPKYFSSEWSFAQFRVQEDTHAIAAFGPEKHSVVIVCANGSFYRCSFDPSVGGEMVREQYERFIKPDEVDKVPMSVGT